MVSYRTLPAATLLLAAFVLSFANDLRGEEGSESAIFRRYSSQVWNTGNGLPQDTVHQLLQTRDGFLWMATEGGLVRFDGYEFAVYDRRNTPQMQSDLVNALFESRTGDLWIATSNGLLQTNGPLNELPPPGGRASPPPARFTRYTTRHGLPSDSVLAIREDQRGIICAKTAGGTACLRDRVFVPAPKTAPAPDVDPTPKPGSLAHATTPDGASWSATSAGLLRSINGQSTPVPMPEGFTGSDVLTLYPDREGNLWVGSENGGVAILRQPPFATLGKRDGLASDQVRSLFEDTDGGLWFGTSGGLTHLRHGQFSTFTVAQGLISNQIIALAGNDSNDIWVGTPDGLNHLQGKRVTTLTASDGLPDDDIRSLLESRDHSLWIGTTHGLAHLIPGTPNIRTWTTADRLPSNVIGSLLEDADGSLRVGTRAGLAHLVNGEIEQYIDAYAPRSPIITALAKDPDSHIVWVGTSGLGLLENTGGGDLMGPHIADLLPETLYSILLKGPGQKSSKNNQSGHAWISSADGIYRIEGGTLQSEPALLQITRYDVADGLRVNDCSSGGHPEAIQSTDGHLFFATSKGVSIVDPAAVSLHPAPPPVALESVLIDDVAAETATSLRVPAGHERIAFHYAGLSFASPSKVRYRYQLEHFDRDWIDAGTRRTAYYTNIPPGRYTFRVLASIDGGSPGSVWSASAAVIDFTIAPHYYQTWWFYTLLLLLVAVMIWQLYLYRLRQVELRFDAVLAERGRIAREIHDTLAQDIVGISVQLELVSRLMTMSIDKAKAQLQETRTLVRRSLEQARSSIWDLRSSSAGDLPTRLRDAAKQIMHDSGIVLRLDIGGTYRGFPQTIEDELLRIAQEAVTNAVRHASPTRIEITLIYHAKGARLEIHDDGRGFVVSGENTGPDGHYGIRGMHERAGRARGTLEIRSSPGTGTTVIAEAPQS